MFAARCLLLLGSVMAALAQQPFLTDDADVTAKHKFHFEAIDEFDWLQRSAYPNLRQNALRYQLNYGIAEHLEIGIDHPFLAIFNAPIVPYGTAVGFGDLDFSVKWNFLREREGHMHPALTVSMAIELPTGKTDRQLGSGLADYWLNGITQKNLTDRITWRTNTGILFSGNTLTGVVGLKAQGVVFTGGSSLTRKFTERLNLGVEFAGAATQNFDLGKAQIQIQSGGHYRLTERLGFDAAITAGRLEGSPRLGMLIGFSVDF